jgi:hypothetical protein
MVNIVQKYMLYLKLNLNEDATDVLALVCQVGR